MEEGLVDHPGSETESVELISDFDSKRPADWLSLVKEIVAMANAHGGQIHIGRDEEGASPGLSDSTVRQLDTAGIVNQVDSHVAPDHVEITATRVKADADGFAVVIVDVVRATAPPIVFTKSGQYQDEGGRQHQVFGKHWVVRRRGTKAEVATRNDYRGWIDVARNEAWNQLKQRIVEVTEIPPGAAVKVLLGNDPEPRDEVDLLLRNALRIYRSNPDQLLAKEDLIRLFLARRALDLSDEASELVIQSALRKRPTLFFWLETSGWKPERIERTLRSALSMSDRDKSDAGRSILEVAALTQPSEVFRRIRDDMKSSRYAHFREAADAYPTQFTAQAKLAEVLRRKLEGTELDHLSRAEIIDAAEERAGEMAAGGYTTGRARKLAELGQALAVKTLGSSRGDW